MQQPLVWQNEASVASIGWFLTFAVLCLQREPGGERVDRVVRLVERAAHALSTVPASDLDGQAVLGMCDRLHDLGASHQLLSSEPRVRCGSVCLSRAGVVLFAQPGFCCTTQEDVCCKLSTHRH
jgi:hypothetical protein